MTNHQRYVSAFLIVVLFVSLLSFSIPQNNERLEENNTPMYDEMGDSPHRGERIGMILTQEANYEFIYRDEGAVPMKFLLENLTVGEEYTLEWKQERYGEIFESGSIVFTGDNETNALHNDDSTLIRKDNVSFEITASTLVEVFTINASLMDQNGTELHWYLDERRTRYHWDWVETETDWNSRESVGRNPSVDYTFTFLNPEQEYNMSWNIWDNAGDVDYPLVYDGGYSMITPDADGNYDATASFEWGDEWSNDVCIEYTIKIDQVENNGQTIRKCVQQTMIGSLPSISGFATIISVLCAAIIFTQKRYPTSSNEDDES